MKNFTKILILITMSLMPNSINAQVGIGTTSPTGALDITSSTDGLVIPRISLTATNVATVTTPTTSELVYNTATAGDVTPGFYYWDGTKWVRLNTGATSAYWDLTGNTGTTAGTNFIGTTDNVDLRFKTGANDRWNISNANNGQLQSYSSGTAALPNYSYQNDQDTGIFSPTTDNLAITTAGTEKLRILVNGNTGIGTTTPAGKLDITSTNDGLVIPRVALTATNAAAPLTAPTTSELVYNTATAGSAPNNVIPGFYYWDGVKWVSIATGSNTDWSLTGNSGTVVENNFMGTTDAVALAIRTNNTERMRFTTAGHVLVNTTTNDATSGADNVFEVLATTAGDDAINGYATGNGIGVFGTTTGNGAGIKGTVNNATAVAISGANTDITGPAIIGSGGNTAGSFYSASGVNGNGTETGVAGMSTTVSTGVGVRGNGNGVSTNTTSGVGAGVAGSGTQIGIFGHASNTTGTKNGGVFTSEHGVDGTVDNPYAYLAGSDGALVYGGYFDANQDNTNNSGGNNKGEDYAYVGVVSGNTTYKILGTGSVSTMVKDENNERRVLFAPEAPEILFQDYGVGQLKNGVTTITLDPILTKNIFVNKKHPLKVFIQLEGDCNGVYVTNKTAAGFTVKELKNGKSNTAFSWQIIANRADMLDANKQVHSKHVDVRFPVGPGPIKHTELHHEKVQVKKEDPKTAK